MVSSVPLRFHQIECAPGVLVVGVYFKRHTHRAARIPSGAGAPDRPGFGQICRSGEKKKPRLFCPFSGLFSGSKLNWTLAFEVSVTDLNLSVFLSILHQSASSNLPTDRPAFLSPPCAPAPLGIRTAQDFCAARIIIFLVPGFFQGLN